MGVTSYFRCAVGRASLAAVTAALADDAVAMTGVAVFALVVAACALRIEIAGVAFTGTAASTTVVHANAGSFAFERSPPLAIV